MYRVGIITASDKGYLGQRVDLSGATIKNIMIEQGYEVTFYRILPDEQVVLKEELQKVCDNNLCDLLITTGGTGFWERDVTPEATMEVAEKNVPGIAEAIRAYSMSVSPRAMLGRGVSVIRKKTLIINLPGSVKAVKESLDFILPSLNHGLGILTGNENECGDRQTK